MTQTQSHVTASELVKLMVFAIQEKKGFNISVIDLREVVNPVTQFMILCSGSSDTQTRAISESVRKVLREQAKELPYSTEGYQKGEWILMDYVNTVVHIFLPATRDYYRLEELWGDTQMTQIPDVL